MRSTEATEPAATVSQLLFGLVTGITILCAVIASIVVVPTIVTVWAAYRQWCDGIEPLSPVGLRGVRRIGDVPVRQARGHGLPETVN